MESLGHSTITITANLYSHVAPELTRDATDRLQTLLG
jgi:high-affinity nickel permease